MSAGTRSGAGTGPLASTGVSSVRVGCYEVPTATDEERDGTLSWSSTAVTVVELSADGVTGLGYTYCGPAAAAVIEGKLAGMLDGVDPLSPQRFWARAQRELRQLGHAGVAAMAASAVDIALWDLKARLLGVCLADLLGRYRDDIAIYGSGGFTNLSDAQLQDQVREWTGFGCRRMKIKIGTDPDRDPARIELVREAAGPGVRLMVDANGAYRPATALAWAQRFAQQGVDYFEEPCSSEDLDGLAQVRRGAPAGMDIAAGEYGWDLPYFGRMLRAGAVDILQADVTRCGGITNMLRVDGLCKTRSLASSAHCAPAVSAHVCCAMETAVHVEYFYDHYRIEGMLFEGATRPSDGHLTPDRDRPGLGLSLEREAADRFAV